MMDRYRATKDNFPRVLVVNGYGFNQSCGGSITLSNLFHGWPKEKLAILFADTYGNDPNIVGNSLALERKIVMPWCNIGFRWDTRAEIKVYAKHQAENQYGLHVYRRIYYSFRTVIKNLLGSLGITDILQKYPLTNEVEKFISSFKPEVVYTHLGNIAFADLTLEITKKNNIPLVVHIMDDYPSTAYKTGFFASLARKIMNNQLSILFRDAAICMGICQAMCDEFRKRYNREFVSFHNPVNPCFLIKKIPYDNVSKANFESTPMVHAVYSGRIGWGVAESLKDICNAFDELASENNLARFTILTNNLELAKEQHDFLSKLPSNVTLEETPQETSQVAEKFKNADILILPVEFDPESIRAIRLSMPTKVPAYMASGTPILLYGPEEVSFVKDASEHGWACVVNTRSKSELVSTIRKLFTDNNLREKISGNAIRISSERYDSKIVRDRFRICLTMAAQKTRMVN